MSISELGRLLGVSSQTVHKLKARGMPVTSYEEAVLWRSRNLDLRQTKEGRINGNTGGRKK